MKEITAAILAVMNKVRRIEKTKRMVSASGGYQYAGIEEIIAELRPVMVANGLIVVPVRSELVESSKITLASNKQMNHYAVKVTFRLAHSSGEFMEGETFGEGADSMDKTLSKSQTSALKYFLLQTFQLQGAHVDPDDYPSEEQGPAKTQRSAKQETKPEASPPATPTAEDSSKLALAIIAELSRAKDTIQVDAIKQRANSKRAMMLPQDREQVRKRIAEVVAECQGRQPGEDG